MEDIYIRGIALPPLVRGVTVKDENNDFNVYINTLLCPHMQKCTAAHELKHIKYNHFFDDEPVIYNELEALK